MGKKKGTMLKCGRDGCGHEWEFKGTSEFYTTCPICKTSVRVKK